MPHEILEREEIFKKTSYHLREPITSVFSLVKELLKFTKITRTSYTQNQAINIVYVIICKTGKFSLEISEWNCMPVNYKRQHISPFRMQVYHMKI